MSHKLYTALIVVALGAGIYIGKVFYSGTSTVEIEKEVVRTDVVTVVKTIERKDGTKETISTTTDKSVAKSDSTVKIVSAPPARLYSLTASYSVQPTSGSYAPVYGIQLTKQFLGPFTLGLRVQSDKQVGMVVGYDF